MTASTLSAEDIDRMADDGEDMAARIRMDTVTQPRLNEAEGADRLRQGNASVSVPPGSVSAPASASV